MSYDLEKFSADSDSIILTRGEVEGVRKEPLRGMDCYLSGVCSNNNPFKKADLCYVDEADLIKVSK